MLVLELNHVCKSGPWRRVSSWDYSEKSHQYCFLCVRKWKRPGFIFKATHTQSPVYTYIKFRNHDLFTGLNMFENSLQLRHNELDGVSDHQPHDCLLNRLFRRWSKKTSKLRVTGLCGGIHRSPVNSPHIGPVTQKMFPFHDVIILGQH